MNPVLSDAIDIALRLNYKERFQTIENFLSVVRTETQTPEPPKINSSNLRNSPYISVISGAFQGNKWAIPKNMEIVVGRAPESSNIVLDDPNISRTHCTIRYDNERRRFFVKDVSSNGTYDNAGRRYEPGKYNSLEPGSNFYLSTPNYRVEVGLE
jgi:hypothetical protein